MTHEQLQQIRDALEHWHEIETASGSVIDYTDELDILDAALAAPVPALQSVSMETVYDTIIEWSTAGKGSRRELARRMIALFAAPQREWQSLTPDEINNCAGAEIYSSTWAMAFAIGIEQTLRRKNT